MPKIIEIPEDGATDEQLDAAVNYFLSLRATRDRQPVLIFDDADGNPQTYTRTSNGELLFGAVRVKDREGLRELLANSLRRGSTVVGIGLVEGSAARENNEVYTNHRSRDRAFRRISRR